MSREEKTKEDLIAKFGFLAQNIFIARARRISCQVAIENFPQVFDWLVKHLNFSILCTITGLDEGENLSFIYHLADEGGLVLNLKTSVAKDNPVLNTVTPYFPSAEIYEREVVDLLGARVKGLTLDNRYPLTDDWPKNSYPLRKDWKPDTQEKKNA